MDSDSETEESVAISRTYDKMKTNVHKIGFVEGLTAGKEAAFQNGFDEGYKEGFSNGYQLGKLNGILRVFQTMPNNDSSVTEVKNIEMEANTRRGLCLLCEPQNMESCQNLCSSEDTNCNPLEKHVKLQQETVQQAVAVHVSKVKDLHKMYNISVLPKSADMCNE